MRSGVPMHAYVIVFAVLVVGIATALAAGP